MEPNSFEIVPTEARKCGEILTFDNLEFYYACNFCEHPMEINVASVGTLLDHIKFELVKNLNKEGLEFAEKKKKIMSKIKDEIENMELVKTDNEISDLLSEDDYKMEESTEYIIDEDENSFASDIKKETDSNAKISIERIDEIKQKKKIYSRKCDDCGKCFASKLGFDLHLQRFCSKSKEIEEIIKKEKLNTQNNKEENNTNEICNKMLEAKFSSDTQAEQSLGPKFSVLCKCGKRFRSQKTYENHNCGSIDSNKKRSKSNVNELGRYTCDQCPETFEKEHQLRNHKINGHSGDLTCELCGKIFTTVKYYQAHKEDVHTDVTYACQKCDKVFKKRSLLKDHNMRDHLKKYQCEVCLKTFVSSTQVKAHSTIHGAMKNFQCDECGRAFPRHFQLRLHKKFHTQLKEYECDICFKRFNTDRAVRNHKYYHTDERKHVCPICSKAFKTTGCLRKHKKIHSRDSGIGYTCDVCGKLFSQSYNMKIHMKTHNVPVFEILGV